MTADLPRKRIIGYADRLSVAPGERIAFKASCEGIEQVRADVVRLISADLHPQGRGWIEEEIATDASGTYPAREQAIPAGSFAIVPASPLMCGETLDMGAWIWPTTPGRGEQVVMARLAADGGRGWALMLDADGALAIRTAERGRVKTVSTGVPLPARVWTEVGASIDGEGQVHVWQKPQQTWPGHDTTAEAEGRSVGYVDAEGLPLTFAAHVVAEQGARLFSGLNYNGKIEGPSLWRDGELVGAWDFARDTMSEAIRDSGPSRLDGRLVNIPTRAMKGHAWSGEVMDWKQAPEQYGAIHFHDDDISDCGWETDVTLTVPDDLPSGIYAARLKAGDDVDHIPFVVLPPRGRATADTLFLMPSASYLAYANEHAAAEGGGHMQAFSDHLSGLSAQDLLLDRRPDLGYSLYCHHSDGSGVAVSSRLRPVLNFRPGVTNAWVGPAGTFPWQFNADLPLVDFLHHEGVGFDVATDEDLHREGVRLLERYRVVLTGSHPEYYSREMHDGLQAYLGQGGRLMYLGGNGFYWRVAFHPEVPGVIELRRGEDGIRDWVAEGGRVLPGLHGGYGGMWERQGRPIHALAGVGMAGQGFDASHLLPTHGGQPRPACGLCLRRHRGRDHRRFRHRRRRRRGHRGRPGGLCQGLAAPHPDPGVLGRPLGHLLPGARGDRQRPSHDGRQPEPPAARRPCLLRDGERRGGVLDRLDRLDRQPVVVGLRQQRGEGHRQRAGPLPRSGAVSGAVIAPTKKGRGVCRGPSLVR